jgi:hypothetical protein
LSKQHQHHLRELGETSRKLWNISRFCPDPEFQCTFITVCLLFEEKRWDKLRVVVACMLVRSKERCHEKDFGTLRRIPSSVDPAIVRFIIARIPEGVDATAKKWHGIVTGAVYE